MDPLAAWWRHPVQVERLSGSGAYGNRYGAATTELAAIDDRRRMVRDAGGTEVVSESTVLLPIATADIPLGSRVTLPAAFGARRATVLAVSRHDSGGQPTPNHLELALT